MYNVISAVHKNKTAVMSVYFALAVIVCTISNVMCDHIPMRIYCCNYSRHTPVSKRNSAVIDDPVPIW